MAAHCNTVMSCHLAANHAAIAELRQRAQWVLYKLVRRDDGRLDKPPFDARTGTHAKSTDSSTWGSYEEASAALGRGAWDGVGFVVSAQDPYVGIDLDACIDPATGEVAPWALAIVEAMSSYTERTPSGTGLRIWARGVWRGDRHKKTMGQSAEGKTPAVEVYDRARFFTVTGRHFGGTPATIEERQEELDALCAQLWPAAPDSSVVTAIVAPPRADLGDEDLIERAMRARNGDKFATLWRGDTSDYGGDDSAADLALCDYLRFWAGGDRVRMDRLFRRSGLMRPKWDERRGAQTYGERTLAAALQGGGEVYDPRTHSTDGGRRTARTVGGEDVAEGPAWEEPAPLADARPESFPIEALPGWVRAFVEGISEAMQTPVDLAANLALDCIATAVQRHVEVQVRDGWREPLSRWSVTALPPGSRKTPVFKAAEKPIRRYQLRCAQRDEGRNAELKAKRDTAEARLKHLQGRASKEDEPNARAIAENEVMEQARLLRAMEMPASVRFTVDDATPEALGGVMEAHGGRIAVLADEGGVFSLMAGRYSNGIPNIDLYLKAHCGGTVEIDRVSRGTTLITRAALTFGLAVQPDVIRGLMDVREFAGRGMLARFLYSIPATTVGNRQIRPRPCPADALRKYGENLERLLGIPAPEIGEDGEETPFLLRFSEDADLVLSDFEHEIEPQLRAGNDRAAVIEWHSKLPGQTARNAGLIHIAAHAESPHPWDYEVDAKTAQWAVKLARYYASHARIAFGLMSADPALEGARAILSLLADLKIERFTKRELLRKMHRTFARAEDLERPLQILVDHGYLRAATEERSPRGGWRPAAYLVHPALWSECHRVSPSVNGTW